MRDIQRLMQAAVLILLVPLITNAQTITKASLSADGALLTIIGTSLGTNRPTVQLGSAHLGVISFSPTQVVASVLPGSLPPGTYLLHFTKANGATADFDVTIGAVGPPGPPGPAGTPGTSGAGALVTPLAVGDPNCENGGAKITDGSSPPNVAYVCNGGRGTTTCIPGGTCSVTGKTGCAYDSNCALGETCTWAGATNRFADNGNGTVTDKRTCLVWEKKTPAGTGDVHDVQNLYTWSTGSPWNFTGTAATLFLKQLNDTAFAGHTDWRLPTSAGDKSFPTGLDPELESIVLAPYPCGTSPCIDPVFGATAADFYWASSTASPSPAFAWAASFGTGFVGFEAKDNADYVYVRAVRGSP